ncbi:MAG TPA: hypothetical protein VGD71_34400 [Kribbella sp.]|jgi:hypothetical protein
MSSSTIQSKLNSVFSQQEKNQFGENRFALLFKPGSYADAKRPETRGYAA